MQEHCTRHATFHSSFCTCAALKKYLPQGACMGALHVYWYFLACARLMHVSIVNVHATGSESVRARLVMQ